MVTPQAVAYAQIAGLPPQYGLIAAPGALLGYALLGTSRTLIVSATTATSALSAAAVGPLAGGDPARFAALSAALALVAGAALVAGGLLRLGAITDFVSKPVITGFLFGLGLVIAVGQLPKLLGLPAQDGGFFAQLGGIAGDLDQVHGWTLAAGAASVAGLVLLKRVRVPAILAVLAAAIVVSALLGLDGRGVAVVGDLPSAFPDPAVPDVDWDDLAQLLPAGIAVMVLSTEGVSVARALAAKDGYDIDVNREMVAVGGGNLLSGISSGFVQCGGASQTAAAEEAGSRTQLTSVVAAILIALTGAFLTGLFADLPEATLGAIVAVAVSGFWRVGELRRFARLRPSAVVLAGIALAGVLVLGVLPGLLVAAALSLALVVYRLSRPEVAALAQDPASGAWALAGHHPDWPPPEGVVVARVGGPLFYANAEAVKGRLLALTDGVLVLELPQADIDVESADMLGEVAEALRARGGELRLAAVRAKVRDLLAAAGVDVAIQPTLDHPAGVSRTPTAAP